MKFSSTKNPGSKFFYKESKSNKKKKKILAGGRGLGVARVMIFFQRIQIFIKKKKKIFSFF